MVTIAKRIVEDLLKIARRNTRLKEAPAQGDWRKAASSYWTRALARYLLFAMQKVKFLNLRPEHKENLLFQVGYPADISLSKLFGGEDEVFSSIPHWIIIPGLSSTQLIMLANDQAIVIPENCCKTRDSLSKLILKAYNQWDKVLQNGSCTLLDLLSTFEHIDDFSYDVTQGKRDIRLKIRPINPGDEVLILWVTADCKGFCPTLKRVPGPTIHKNLVTTCLHDCSLLHVSSVHDLKPTRIFSDTDCRTTCLHLRRDSGEDTLTLCKQLGWKNPPACSDSGSTVYRRGDAIVRSPEYNSSFISWLQLQVEGKIAGQVGIDWSTAVENARLRWIQLKMHSEWLMVNNEVKQKKFIKSCIDEQFQQLDAKLDKQIKNIAMDITAAVVQSLQSASDVNQKINTRIQKRKRRIIIAFKFS
jgi:hypothetical protein